ncbi:MAG: hypothetical protein AAFR22_19800 [Chloroflexota bacterium]
MTTVTTMKNITILLVIALCVLAVPVSAQNGGLIAYGALVNGELTNDVSLVEYTFAGGAGDLVLFTVLPADRDLFPLLTLQNANGSVIATSNFEQGLYNRNGATLALRLLEGGTYTLAVGRLQGTGQYALRVDGLSTAENAIPYGEPVLVQLSPETPFQTFQYGGGLLRMNAIDAESGYIAEIFSRQGQAARVYGSIAQDVSISLPLLEEDFYTVVLYATNPTSTGSVLFFLEDMLASDVPVVSPTGCIFVVNADQFGANIPHSLTWTANSSPHCPSVRKSRYWGAMARGLTCSLWMGARDGCSMRRGWAVAPVIAYRCSSIYRRRPHR